MSGLDPKHALTSQVTSVSGFVISESALAARHLSGVAGTPSATESYATSVPILPAILDAVRGRPFARSDQSDFLAA